MTGTSNTSVDEKLRAVLSVLAGEQSHAEAARRTGVVEQSVRNWKKQFLEAGRQGLAGGRRSSREKELEAENEELKAALGEAHVQLRVWRKGAEYFPPSRNSR